MTDAHPTDLHELEARTQALKERIYATFTGLAIVAAVSTNPEVTGLEALLAVGLGVIGISAAGFLAEVVAHQIMRGVFPTGRELRIMGRIAVEALGSASIPLIVLAIAAFGLMPIGVALWIAVGLYAATLVAIILWAAHRSGLRFWQRVAAAGMLAGLAVIVAAVLLVAHLV